MDFWLETREIRQFASLQVPIGRERTRTRASVTLRIAPMLNIFPMLRNNAL
jgi:hypothetical protein